MPQPKPGVYRFPIGGGRFETVSSPFRGERPFGDSFERFANQLARVISKLDPCSTAVGTGPRTEPMEFGTIWQADAPEEALACGWHGYRPNPMLLVGISYQNQAPNLQNPTHYADTLAYGYKSTLVQSLGEIDSPEQSYRLDDGGDNAGMLQIENTLDVAWGTTGLSTVNMNAFAMAVRVDKHQVVKVLQVDNEY